MRVKKSHGWRKWLLGLVVLIAIVVSGGWIYRASTLSYASQKATSHAAVVHSAAKPVTVAHSKAKKVPVVNLATRLHQQWATLIPKTQPKVAVAVYDPKTQQTTAYTNQTKTTTYCAASTVKVGILVQLLHQRDRGALTLTNQDQQQAVQMIQQSDNDAADSLLFDRLGGTAALTSLYQQLKMTHSHAAPINWGLSTTTAVDQLRLLKVIFQPNHYLSNRSRQLVQQLMGSVVAYQAWGVSQGAQTFKLKNGWLDADDAGHWAVNSIGKVTEKKRQTHYLMAIYTNDNPDQTSGIKLVNRIAQGTNQILNQ